MQSPEAPYTTDLILCREFILGKEALQDKARRVHWMVARRFERSSRAIAPAAAAPAVKAAAICVVDCGRAGCAERARREVDRDFRRFCQHGTRAATLGTLGRAPPLPAATERGTGKQPSPCRLTPRTRRGGAARALDAQDAKGLSVGMALAEEGAAQPEGLEPKGVTAQLSLKPEDKREAVG